MVPAIRTAVPSWPSNTFTVVMPGACVTFQLNPAPAVPTVVTSMVSPRANASMVAPLRSAARLGKGDAAGGDADHHLVPSNAPATSRCPEPPAISVSLASLAYAVRPDSPFNVSVVDPEACSTFTVAMPVMAAPSTTLPPPDTTTWLAPAPPSMVAPAVAAVI